MEEKKLVTLVTEKGALSIGYYSLDQAEEIKKKTLEINAANGFVKDVLIK